VLPALVDLRLASSPEEWGCIMGACHKALGSTEEALKLATLVIWAGALYGRLDDPQVVGFIEAYRRLCERSAAAMQAARTSVQLRRTCARVGEAD
jgi:hypothetical protein